MFILLNPGEKVEVQFHQTDGAIVVKFDEDAIRVETDLPDDQGRVNVIYEEKFVTMEELGVAQGEPVETQGPGTEAPDNLPNPWDPRDYGR